MLQLHSECDDGKQFGTLELILIYGNELKTCHLDLPYIISEGDWYKKLRLHKV